jgi:hypothetical protein
VVAGVAVGAVSVGAVGTDRTVGAVCAVVMGTLLKVGTAGAAVAGTVGANSNKALQFVFEQWVLIQWVVGAVGAVGVGRAGAVGVETGLGAVEAVGTSGAMATFRVAAFFALLPVLLLLCAPLPVVGGVGTVTTVGAVGVGEKVDAILGAGGAMRTFGALASLRVAAIFALQPVVDAIVAVGALGGWKVGTVEDVGAAPVGGKGGSAKRWEQLEQQLLL